MQRLETKFQSRTWATIRKIVLERDGYKCRFNYKNCLVDKNLGVHHIIPFCRSFSNDITILATACKNCHKSADNNFLRFGLTHFMRKMIEENRNDLKSGLGKGTKS